ncbi:hypothetical protein JVU11DRAFT_4452 [Chiua virens]|nr:hypothetical protein JVU11DRAFT_4452 [Chiua virens]
MSIPTDNSAVTEHDTLSDSDWLDISSTDRDSDDNDSIYSSRETDHEDLSRSRSRRSSFSYGSSREGDVDAWEGLIDDSADEGVPSDALTSALNPHVPSEPSATVNSDPTQETSLEELRVKEGLDQSMISTLSSSRSSSLHSSTVHSPSRDLRLSFPDPITSSLREHLSTSYEEIQCGSDLVSSPLPSDVPSDALQGDDDDEMLSASQVLTAQSPPTLVPSPSGPELKVFLFGLSTFSKWSIVDTLLQKVARGAGLTITTDLDDLQGYTRRLSVHGPFENDHAFPRVVTVVDKTLDLDAAIDDLASIDSSRIRPLAVVFLPCRTLHLPEHVLCLPISASAPELPDFGNVETGSHHGTWDTLSIPNHRILRMAPLEDSAVVDRNLIDSIDPSRAYRVFSRLWAGEHTTSKGVVATTHALTIIAILSLVLGVIVRAALPVSLQAFTSATLATPHPNSTPGALWQLLRPAAPYRERLPPSPTWDNSVAVSSSAKDFSLSIFTAESTSIMVSRANPTNFRRTMPSTFSEQLKFSKDLMLQPPCSVLPLDNSRPKALSVIPETSTTTSYHPGPATTGHAVTAMVHTSVPGVVKEYAPVAVAIMNQDMQDIFDALDALAQAISRQTQMILARATTLLEHSVLYLEKSAESLETIKDTFHARNEHARKRAKEIRDLGTKWLYDASEAISSHAQFSKGVAQEWAEGFASRAQRARGRAKEVAAELHGLLRECDGLEALGKGAWDPPATNWEEWLEQLGQHMGKGKSFTARSCKPKLKSGVFS